MMRTSLVIAALLSFTVTVLAEPRQYTQDVSITFATPEQAAAAATLTPLPVLDGKPWALSARWDDNHPGNLKMREVMAKHGLKGTFYLNATDAKGRFGEKYVEELLQGGFSIGGHTQSHAYLNKVTPAEMFYEILANRVERESQADQSIVSFVPPYGVWQDAADPDMAVRFTEALRRSGMHHMNYVDFVKSNPNVRPGEFSTTLQVVPGDHTVDPVKFNTNLEKLFKFPAAYQKFGYDVSLGVHARQQGEQWDALDKLFGELKARADWWFCNQNEYAAYERQVKHTTFERASVDGATATFRVTRPVPAELGADVPLTVEVAGEVTAVKGDANHTHRHADGKSLINLAHGPRQAAPAVVDAIDNPKNDPAPAGESKDFPGVVAWLHAADDQLTLTLENRGATELADVHVTWRLPLAYEQGVQRSAVANLKPGENRTEVCKAGALSGNASRTAGGRYYVAEIDFRHGEKPARLFATATVGDVIPTKPAAGAPAVPAAPAKPAADMTPFVIPLDVNPSSAIAFKGGAIAVDGPRVVARDGHFFIGENRFRAWGVNLNAGACFPDNARADRMAARLEAAGVNSVRLHHMDNQWTRFPESIWDKDDPAKVSAEALDRLDYFVDQLARRGIYVNLNLHVSRTHSAQLGLPLSKATGNYDKMVDLFTPQLIAAQRDYARQLLTRVNKHRGVTYAADPAVAFVEINNENSLFMWDYPAKLKGMHPFYADLLRQQFNTWLQARYGTSAKLAAAWDAGDANAATAESLPAWRLTQTGGAAATVAETADSTRIAITAGGKATWNVEYQTSPLPIRADRYYTLSFRARADAARTIVCRVGKAGPPYNILGLRETVKLTGEWQDFKLGFQSPLDEATAALSFHVGQSTTGVEIADVTLQSQALKGLQPNETIEAVSIAFNLDGESKPRLHDRLRFMAETEKAYYDSFRAFLKDDLGCKSLITGTMVYGPLALWAQSGMDYLDTHAYWSHPTFPGGAWSDSNWTIDQKAMTDAPPLASKLMEAAAARLAGKPFTVSEYNHPAPNDAQAEAVPMVAAMAAAQDWDGVWLFAYSSTSADSNGAFANWFEIEQNPAKWGFMPTAAALYRDGGIEPLANALVIPLSSATDPLPELAALQAAHGPMLVDSLINTLNVPDTALTTQRLHVAFTPTSLPDTTPGSTTTITWQTGRFHARGRGGQVLCDTATTGFSSLRTDKPRFAVLTAAALDGQPIDTSRRVLFTLAGRCENVGMTFSPDRRTVAKSWGQPPVQIEKLSATLAFPTPPGLTLHALAPDGVATTTIPQPTPGKLTFPDSAGTMWFLLKE